MNSHCLIRGCFSVMLLLTGTFGSFAQTLSVTNDLQLWLRADAGVTTNVDGGVVQWDDQSTNANNAVQVTNAQAPLFVPAALNGQPVLRFDGADDFLDVADSDSLSGTGDMASFFVVRFDDFATFRAVWAKTAGNLPAPTDIYVPPNPNVVRAFRGDGTLNNLSSVDTAQSMPANRYLVLGFDVAGETLTHYLNNQPNGSGVVTTNTADGNTALKIGTRSDFVTRLKGDLAELLIYSRALSATERSNVFSYLQTKYNLLNLAPSVDLATSPAGPNVSVGQEITLNATPTDLDGTIARVDYFGNGRLLGSATQPPYSMRVTIDSAGSVQFSARAFDDRGAFADASPVSLTAGPAGPTTLPVTAGLQLWLRADAGTFTGLSDGVVQWADQSGNVNDAFQSDENLAPVLTNAAVNGLPALRFDGANDFMEVADADSISITGDITSFFVLKFTDFATFRAIWAKTTGNLPAPTDMYGLPNNGRLRLYRGNGTGPGSQLVDSAQPFAAGTFLLGGFDIAGTAVRHFYNGVLNGTGAITVPTTDNNGPLRIGTRADLATRFRGEMAEILIYDRALSATERRSVERHLAEKYALPIVLTTNTSASVAITGPGGQVFQSPGMVTVTADASDADGSIASVQFFADGVSLGTDTSGPFSASLSFSNGGAITVSAIVTDNLGGRTTSAPFVVCVQGPTQPLGLVSYWPLNGDATAVVGTNGMLVNNPTPAADRNGNAGGALSFNGAQSQRVEVPGGGGLNGATRGTISMWVKWSGTQDGGFGGSFGAVLSRQQDGVFSDNIINLNNANPDSAFVQWRQTAAGTVNITGNGFVGNDTWRHIAVTFTETSSQLFVDGASQGTGGGGALHNNTATALAIGAWAGGGGSYATATIDDVGVWNRVLSATEIQALAAGLHTPYNLLIPPDCPSIERSGTNVTVRWRSEGVLQHATDVIGPYQDVTDATSPYSPSLQDSWRFYRLRSP